MTGGALFRGGVPREKLRSNIEPGGVRGTALLSRSVFGLFFARPDPSLAVNLLRKPTMRNTFIALLPAVGAALALAHAGEPTRDRATASARPHFRESAIYPFVFRAESYLATNGPVPMRFAPAPPHCPERNAPALTPAAKGVEIFGPPASAKSSDTAPAEEPDDSGKVAHTAPTNAPSPARDEIDFGRVPNEVLDFFKNTEGRPIKRSYLFDPIFQPALLNELPKSKATSQQK